MNSSATLSALVGLAALGATLSHAAAERNRLGAGVAALRDRLATAAAAPVVLSVAPLRDGAATSLESNRSVQVSSPKQGGDFVKLIASYVTRRQAGTAIDCGPS
jgi:hypothetical protein